MKRILVTSTVFLTLLGGAEATTLSGVLYGSANQSAAACFLYNPTGAAIAVAQAQLFQQTIGQLPATPLRLTYSDCALVQPNGICVITATVSNAKAIGCKITFAPNSTAVRGDLQLRNGGTVFQNVPLQ